MTIGSENSTFTSKANSVFSAIDSSSPATGNATKRVVECVVIAAAVRYVKIDVFENIVASPIEIVIVAADPVGATMTTICAADCSLPDHLSEPRLSTEAG